jgi:cobalt-zinc-cadmium efflux system membrane fusion protein
MANQQLHRFVGRLRHSLHPEASGLTDSQLLERFVSSRDEAAFEVLVWRHGPMVLGVCRRILHHAEDAEDVFQATFLALARKAGSIGRREALGGWLHTTASRTALRLRLRASGQPRLEQLPGDIPAPETGDQLSCDLRPVLDEEISRLPMHYRLPVILCYLQGKTTEEAARQLGCARGTICSRLAWARDRLRSQLSRRGLALTGASLVMALSREPALAMPGELVLRTLQGALGFAGGQVMGAIAPQVVTLAEGVLKTMFLTKLKLTVAGVLLVSVVAVGAGLFTQHIQADKPGPAAAPELVAGDAGTIRLPAEMLAPLGIQAREVQPRGIPKSRVLVLPGSTALDPTRLVRIRVRFAPAEVVLIGKVQEFNSSTGRNEVRELRTGDRVKKGDVLAVFFSADVGSKKNDLLEGLIQLELDQKVLDGMEKAKDAIPQVRYDAQLRTVYADRNAVTRALNNLKVWNIPQDEIDAIREEARKIAADKNAWFKTPEGRWVKGEKQDKGKADPDRKNENPWGRVTLRAPIDGIIVERNIVPHEIVQDPTTIVFQIAQVDRLLVIANAPEDELPNLNALKPEERVWTVKAVAATVDVKGPWEEISYLIDPIQHTAVIKGHIDNAGEKLRAGQFITAAITLPSTTGEMAVPAAAVVEEDGKSFVFLQPDPKQPIYRQRRVLVVRRSPEAVHIRSPLSAEEERKGSHPLRTGDRVITSGAVELKAILDDLKAKEKR